MKHFIKRVSRRIRMMRINRQAKALLRRARYTPSVYLVGYVPPVQNYTAQQTLRPWIVVAALFASFLVGALVRNSDDLHLTSRNQMRFVSGCVDTRLATLDQSDASAR